MAGHGRIVSPRDRAEGHVKQKQLISEASLAPHDKG